MAEHKYSYSRKQTVMSHVDSLDEETKQILKDIQSQETHSDDSKESDKPKEPKKELHKNDEGNEYDESENDNEKDIRDNKQAYMDDNQW